MTFYQGLLLEIIASCGYVDHETSHIIQNFLICIEMFLGNIFNIFFTFALQNSRMQ